MWVHCIAVSRVSKPTVHSPDPRKAPQYTNTYCPALPYVCPQKRTGAGLAVEEQKVLGHVALKIAPAVQRPQRQMRQGAAQHRGHAAAALCLHVCVCFGWFEG